MWPRMCLLHKKCVPLCHTRSLGHIAFGLIVGPDSRQKSSCPRPRQTIRHPYSSMHVCRSRCYHWSTAIAHRHHIGNLARTVARFAEGSLQLRVGCCSTLGVHQNACLPQRGRSIPHFRTQFPLTEGKDSSIRRDMRRCCRPRRSIPQHMMLCTVHRRSAQKVRWCFHSVRRCKAFSRR